MKHVQNIEDFLRLSVGQLANTHLICPYCGRDHALPFREVHIGRGIIREVPEIAARLLGYPPRHPVLLYDKHIEPIIEAGAITPLTKLGLSLSPMALGAPDYLLDSDVVVGDQAAGEVDPAADLLIGVGSGVISDLTKWIATALDLPFVICGTAPSMNAYTSITATMTENGIKRSRYLQPADAVVMDVDILAEAPLDMIRAGMGDLTARAICNADWKLSNVLRRTYFCPLPYKMTARGERRYLASAEGIGRAAPEAIDALSEAILLSAYSMTVLAGETSPSSGAEHVLSHFWDLQVKLRHAPKNLHGAQVAVGTIISLNVYDYMRAMNPDSIDPQALLRQRRTLREIRTENAEKFGSKGDAFNEVIFKKRVPDDLYVDYITAIRDNWEKLWTTLAPYVPPVDAIRAPLEKAGVPLTLDAIQRTREDALEALLYGNRYRPRYTILDLAWELGVFPDAAPEILARSGVV
jgi:glycerol-1-phosphate dehydrogenase [NAD(P)+]